MKTLTDDVEELNRFGHIDKYFNESIVQQVLLGETSFKKEVKIFYDVKNVQTHMGRGVPPFQTYSFKKTSKPNCNQSPSTLIEIVAPFSYEKSLNESLLKYNLVIEDYIAFKKSWPRRSVSLLLHMGVMFGTAGAAIYSFKNPLFIPVALGGGVLTVYTGIKKPFFPDNKNFWEFQKLYWACRIADDFIPQYKDYLANKYIKQNLN